VHIHPCRACEESWLTCQGCGRTKCKFHTIHQCRSGSVDCSSQLLASWKLLEEIPTVRALKDLEVSQAEAKVEAQEIENQLSRQELSERTDPLAKALKRRKDEIELLRNPMPVYSEEILFARVLSAMLYKARDATAVKEAKGAGMKYLYDCGRQDDPVALSDLEEAVFCAMEPTTREKEIAELLCPTSVFARKPHLDLMEFNSQVSGSVVRGAWLPYLTDMFGWKLALGTRSVPINGKGQDPSSAEGFVRPAHLVQLAKWTLVCGACVYLTPKVTPAMFRSFKIALGLLVRLLRLAGFITNNLIANRLQHY
jgi:hypothetical protein